MDIVSRIKKFLKSQDISSSQFADTCGIPRPTASQLLNGRNKKVSHDIVQKIHTTYPSLNASWLMFGEGEMLIEVKNEISEAQNQQIIDFEESKSPRKEDITLPFDYDDDINEITSNNFSHEKTSNTHEQSQLMSLVSTLKQAQCAPRTRISSNAGFSKSIVNIIVVYDDDTCDLLSPSSIR